MYRKIMALGISIAAIVVTAAQAQPKRDEIESAYALCWWFDHTKLLSEKCQVSGWNSTVEISINMTVNDAQQLCTALPKNMAQSSFGWFFKPGWQLKIFSPFSGQRPIATCDLAEMVESARQQSSGAASSQEPQQTAPVTTPERSIAVPSPPAKFWISPQ
jgi:hypothetical protein